MSGKGGYQGAPPKYMNDFTKALSVEVKMLLEEVGRLRDERRSLQLEIAELMALKSKHGAGGEYVPDWLPKREATPPPPSPPPPLAIEDVQPAKPGWRTIHKRPERKPKPKALPAPAPASAPAPAPPPPRDLPAWAQWRPNPMFSPQPKAATPGAPLPTPAGVSSRAGLFGPPSPPPK